MIEMGGWDEILGWDGQDLVSWWDLGWKGLDWKVLCQHCLGWVRKERR